MESWRGGARLLTLPACLLRALWSPDRSTTQQQGALVNASFRLAAAAIVGEQSTRRLRPGHRGATTKPIILMIGERRSGIIVVGPEEKREG
jgi:hypothetical protein